MAIMKLQYIHSGRQFFFVTIALEGRPKALSRLVDERRRPALLPPGEMVKAALVAMHGVFPAAALSDFVIMPDHVHFLLIANYDLSPAFNPLWASHQLMEAIEEGWRLGPKARGSAPAPPHTAPSEGSGAESPSVPDMPAILAATVARGREEAGILNRARREAEARGADAAEIDALLAATRTSLTAARPVPPLRFDRRCYIELSFSSRQLKTIRRYIRLNPARALWKLRHPDRFILHANLRHPVLAPAHRWAAMGDLTLLASPFLLPVRLTLKKSVAEHEAEIAEILERARQGMIPVSGFLSPGETELLRRLKAEPSCRFIKTVPYALPPKYDPTAEDSRELAADRLLILSAFPDAPQNLKAGFRARCLEMNDLATRLCEAAQTLE